MAKTFIKGAAVAAVVFMGLSANAAHAASAQANAKANILRQITVTKTADLDFGTIVAGSTASTVAVDAAGARTCGAGLVCSGTTTAAKFEIGGANGQTVNISSDATVTLNNGVAGNTMSAALAPSVSTMLLTATPANNPFYVVGTLSVGASQAEGVYQGTFNVNVNYQ